MFFSRHQLIRFRTALCCFPSLSRLPRTDMNQLHVVLERLTGLAHHYRNSRSANYADCFNIPLAKIDLPNPSSFVLLFRSRCSNMLPTVSIQAYLHPGAADFCHSRLIDLCADTAYFSVRRAAHILYTSLWDFSLRLSQTSIGQSPHVSFQLHSI